MSRSSRGKSKRGSRRKLFRLTKRLELRPLRASDYAAWREAALAIDPRMKSRWDMKPSAREVTRAKFAKLLQRQVNERKLDWFYDLGVFRRDTGQLVGKVAVMSVERGLAQAAYLGWRIWNPHWNQGFGTEAARALMDIGFRDLKIHRLEAGIEPGNERSERLARSLRLRKEGLKKRAVFLRGKWRNLMAYVAFSEDFGIRTPPPRRRGT